MHYCVQCLPMQYDKNSYGPCTALYCTPYYTALHCTVLHTVHHCTVLKTDFILYACNVALWSLWWVRVAFHYCLMLIHQHRSQQKNTLSFIYGRNQSGCEKAKKWNFYLLKCGLIIHNVDIKKGKNSHVFGEITIKASPPIYLLYTSMICEKDLFKSWSWVFVLL